MDALTGAELDLVFEERRLFLYGAAARFGALPLEATGDLDLTPRGGQLRLTARVAPTEVNALRASLGVRPLPFPLAGAAGGLVHVTGPLEKPVFSGLCCCSSGHVRGVDADDDGAAGRGGSRPCLRRRCSMEDRQHAARSLPRSSDA